MSAERDSINDAITAHSSWKSKLKEAIESGTSDKDPNIVKTDNACAFGKWLYETIDPSLKSDPHYESIRAKHANFHEHASKILVMAISGQKEQAQKEMEIGSEFMTLSSNLTNELSEWKEQFAV